MHGFGDKLRREREAHGLSLEDMAGATGIGIDYLRSLESGQIHALTGPAFGKLYIRAYAEVLGFDPEAWIEEYGEELSRWRRAESPRERAGERVEAGESDPPGPRDQEAAEPAGEPRQVAPAEAPAEETREGPPGGRTSRRRVGTLPVILLAALALVVLGLGGWGLSSCLRRDVEPAEPSPAPNAKIERSRKETAAATDTPPPQPAPAQPSREEPSAASPSQEPGPAEPRFSPGRLSVADLGLGRRVVRGRLEGESARFEQGEVACFLTRVLGAQPGERVRHVWLHEGRTVQTIELELGGPHWRTFSRKTLRDVGSWAVEARDAEGRVLARAGFTCVPAGS